jgi:exosortase B
MVVADARCQRVTPAAERIDAAPAAVGYRLLLARWWPLALGVVAILVPTWVRFALTVWPEPEYSHAPLVIAMALFLAWRQRAELLRAAPGAWTAPRVLALLLPGALLYVLAVWIQSGFLETVAQIALLAGALAQVGGSRLLRAMLIPLLLLLLSAPLPGNVIDGATNALKQWVSASAETLLYSAGYPIARSGVLITIGSYQMLVAEACSGMNSLFSLSAVGLFYLFLVPRRSAWQTLAIALAILPLAVVANILRVVILVLVTYYLGDDAGQGFLHEFAGFVMFLCALGGLFVLDGTLSAIGRRRAAGSAPSAVPAGAASHG